MQLGFVSAILSELSLEEILAFASEEGFGCVELMCWPKGSADRRYGGITHIDVDVCDGDAIHHIREMCAMHGVAISALGYYPNPLDPDPEHRRTVVTHLQKVIRLAPRLGVKVVNTFIGRNWKQTVEENWPTCVEVWSEIIATAEAAGVQIGLENCPMLFSRDEWPGGKNLASTPAVWRRLFQQFPTRTLGLNFDPSHLIWQQIDPVRCIREFGDRIVHVHAKDTRIDSEKLYEVGVTGLGWYISKIPGLGDVDWRKFFAALTDVGYTGPVCVEVEDRAFEGSLADRKRALRQSRGYLGQFVS